MVNTAIISAFLVVCLGALALGARDIYGDVRFHYDPESQLFVTVTITKCYLVALSHVEREHVHSHGGMEDIEISLMRNWLGILSETRMYHDDKTLSMNIRSWCVQSPHDIFKLNRVIPTEAPGSGLVG